MAHAILSLYMPVSVSCMAHAILSIHACFCFVLSFLFPPDGAI